MSKYGYWLVRRNGVDQTFDRKLDALLAAGANGHIEYVYHNHIWDSFDRSQLGKVKLDTLYHMRAQQLRDKYGYLKLYYSGGADSHNILMTFINNKIHLDEVVIRWPKFLRDGKGYTPSTDSSSFNLVSEWDFSIKPRLEWLAKNHPNIKITFSDITEGLTKKSIAKTVESSAIFAGLHTIVYLLKHEETSLQHKTGYIFGVDKPMVGFRENKAYYMFTEFGRHLLGTGHVESDHIDTRESFYWTPDLPLLPVEMAYQYVQRLKQNPTQLAFVSSSSKSYQEARQKFQVQHDVAKAACYTTWDGAFQADKPKFISGLDMYTWFSGSSDPIMQELNQAYVNETRAKLMNVHPRFVYTDTYNGSSLTVALPVASKSFYLCDI